MHLNRLRPVGIEQDDALHTPKATDDSCQVVRRDIKFDVFCELPSLCIGMRHGGSLQSLAVEVLEARSSALASPRYNYNMGEMYVELPMFGKGLWDDRELQKMWENGGNAVIEIDALNEGADAIETPTTLWMEAVAQYKVGLSGSFIICLGIDVWVEMST